MKFSPVLGRRVRMLPLLAAVCIAYPYNSGVAQDTQGTPPSEAGDVPAKTQPLHAEVAPAAALDEPVEPKEVPKAPEAAASAEAAVPSAPEVATPEEALKDAKEESDAVKTAIPPVSEDAPAQPTEDPELLLHSVKLRALNKVTAKTSYIDVTVGTSVHFGNLEIIARRCWKAPPEDRPENAAMLDIWEQVPGEQPHRVFVGWMFSSSPALSSLEHPVYDITVSECTDRGASSEDPS